MPVLILFPPVGETVIVTDDGCEDEEGDDSGGSVV